jgi:hypothetical protein
VHNHSHEAYKHCSASFVPYPLQNLDGFYNDHLVVSLFSVVRPCFETSSRGSGQNSLTAISDSRRVNVVFPLSSKKKLQVGARVFDGASRAPFIDIMNAVRLGRDISPNDNHRGRCTWPPGGRVGSTAHNAAHRSGCAIPISNTPLPPKLKPVR